MSVLGAIIVLAVVVWIFFAVSYISSKGKSNGSSCGGGGCDGNCMSCSLGGEPGRNNNKDKKRNE